MQETVTPSGERRGIKAHTNVTVNVWNNIIITERIGRSFGIKAN
ncbi:hypothetical protein LEP1GSC103_0865 [Leptospira borgpetersenii serovar Javanica str. UI 09931]|uniref:Uncharacterized protein n=1 Tax=Leptospira borgpetersenii serovar Javanica str. UI 09931 TaxID=1049767 RepID=A0AAV3J6I8_LEPBO|nr:hypothetical protein LEP1GSC101_0572 [Leptospira borgpetersenii str. UI 09149]EMN59689.1 hypothetical protein LEP1GSC090_2849 [Leptospira borgpetersenii serovar Javanica str. MK146]EPG55963.1 hypothetical protein LEP1GSC103_0865 [Leptospira borgpetersenii serovar Javanica str. UI 09931]